MTVCPDCGHRFAEDGTTEVHAKVRASEQYGLRIDVTFVCAGCDENIIIEDIPADEGLIGTISTNFLSRFDGKGFHA